MSFRTIEYIALVAIAASAFIPGEAFSDYRKVTPGLFGIVLLAILAGHPQTTAETVASAVDLIIAVGVLWFIFPRLKKIFLKILEKR